MVEGEILVCWACKRRNRVPPQTGTKGIRCGFCRADLPTPAIERRLLDVRDELADLLSTYRRFDVHGRREIERRLNRQLNILATVTAVWPGFERTRRASIDLATEIDSLSAELQCRLEANMARTALQILLAILRSIHLTYNIPRGLPPGLSGG
jgi:hypothetical protein